MMTREYLRYALMAAILGFWLLFASIGLGWGGMLGIFYFLRLVPMWANLPCLLGILVGGACIPLIAVTALTRRLAVEAPQSCSVFAGLFPLLPPLPVLVVILSNREYFVSLEEQASNILKELVGTITQFINEPIDQTKLLAFVQESVHRKPVVICCFPSGSVPGAHINFRCFSVDVF